jgi:hypothetical protein
MERQARRVIAKANGRVRTQYVYAMSSNRQLFAKLGRDDPAAAD